LTHGVFQLSYRVRCYQECFQRRSENRTTTRIEQGFAFRVKTLGRFLFCLDEPETMATGEATPGSTWDIHGSLTGYVGLQYRRESATSRDSQLFFASSLDRIE